MSESDASKRAAEIEQPANDELPLTSNLWPMLKLAAPIIIIQFAVVAMQFVDGLMLAWLGKDELAAILPATITTLVMLSTGLAMLGAVGTFVSQSYGRGETEKCGHFAWQGSFLALAYGLLCLPLYWLAEPLFALYQHEPKVQALGVAYFEIAVLRVAPQLMVTSLSSFYTGVHRPGVLAIAALAGMVLNIFFNWLLIFGYWGFPQLGVAGASWATLAAVVFQVIGLHLHFLATDFARRYGTRIVRLDPSAMWGVVKVGIPAGAQFLVDILSWGVALTYFVGLSGKPHLAAATIAVNYMHMAFMPSVGLGMILQAMVGRSIGAGMPDLAAAQVRTAARTCMVYMGVLGLCFAIFRVELIRLYTLDPEIIRIGSRVIVIMAACQFFDAMNITYTFALRGAGDTFWPAITTLFLVAFVMIGGCLYMVNYQPELNSLGPWIAGASYIGTLGLAMWIRWSIGAWRHIQIFGKDAVH